MGLLLNEVSVFRVYAPQWRSAWSRPMPGLPRKGRPAALGASPCPRRAALRERGEGAKRHRGVFHLSGSISSFSPSSRTWAGLPSTSGGIATSVVR